MIAGPSGSGKSKFVRRFAHNIKHMMTPKPDRFLWCYGEYQTLYGTVEEIEFQQGLPDLDNLDPRDKHFIILGDLMDEHHKNRSGLGVIMCLML
jgi:energy-coupling factor transporter ATP-binding protein EcfA2